MAVVDEWRQKIRERLARARQEVNLYSTIKELQMEWLRFADAYPKSTTPQRSRCLGWSSTQNKQSTRFIGPGSRSRFTRGYVLRWRSDPAVEEFQATRKIAHELIREMAFEEAMMEAAHKDTGWFEVTIEADFDSDSDNHKKRELSTAILDKFSKAIFNTQDALFEDFISRVVQHAREAASAERFADLVETTRNQLLNTLTATVIQRVSAHLANQRGN